MNDVICKIKHCQKEGHEVNRNIYPICTSHMNDLTQVNLLRVSNGNSLLQINEFVEIIDKEYLLFNK